MSLLLLVSSLVFLDALPDALPDAADAPVVVTVTQTPKLAPPKPELPKPKPAGHWENRRQCGPNGCQYVPVWVADDDVAPAAPPIPSEADANREQPAETAPAESYYPRRFFWRRWR